MGSTWKSGSVRGAPWVIADPSLVTPTRRGRRCKPGLWSSGIIPVRASRTCFRGRAQLERQVLLHRRPCAYPQHLHPRSRTAPVSLSPGVCLTRLPRYLLAPCMGHSGQHPQSGCPSSARHRREAGQAQACWAGRFLPSSGSQPGRWCCHCWGNCAPDDRAHPTGPTGPSLRFNAAARRTWTRGACSGTRRWCGIRQARLVPPSKPHSGLRPQGWILPDRSTVVSDAHRPLRSLEPNPIQGRSASACNSKPRLTA